MTADFASRIWNPVRVLPFLLPVSAALAQTDTSAMQWLQRIYSASERLSYTGTFVYQQGQRVETSRIVHVADVSGPRERLETLDGVPREIVRSGDEVVCYLPESMTVKIDKQPGRRPFPAILSEQLKDVSDNYTVKKGDIERVGGYSCQVLTLEPKDRMRYGHRLWADVSTGMLLRTKTFNEKNELLEQFAFTQIKIGGSIARDQLKPRYFRQSKDWRIEDSGAIRANLAESGWTIRSKPPGFRTVAELTRTVGGTEGVGHIVLSDGLAAISVFIELATSKRPAPQAGLARQGPINVYVRPVGNYWVTVVGEAPAESVKYVANAVEYHK
ncbi:MAG TPA: MucB/RseB C-terminal domain-containing protein [Burkholderiales bacterium]|nr:MucB/RseB C-terminal domain-containing protein [Burkholderiales bacterium]